MEKNILIIINGGLPVPSIKGGAIETLITMLIDDNELKNKYKFTIFSNYVEEVENIKDVVSKYKNTNFVYLRTNTILYKINYFVRGIIRKIFKINIKSAFTRIAEKELKRSHKKFDLVISQNYISLVSLFKNKYNLKVIPYIHNDGIINKKANNPKTAIQNSEAILTVSNYMRNTILSTLKNDKTYTIYNGIDSKKFFPISLKQKELLRKKYGLANNDCIILFVGRISEEKGIDKLLKAFNTLSKENDNCKLLIAGSSFYGMGGENSFTKKLIKMSNDNCNSIIFTGYIPNEKMPQIYQMADVLVIPTMIEEACPLTLIEGMSVGIPTIVTNSGGMPELITEETSIVVNRKQINKELYTELKKLINSPKKRKEMSQSSINHSKKYSSEKYLDNMYDFIDKYV